MAAWTGQLNTVSLAWTANLKGSYYRNQKIGTEFVGSWAPQSAISVNSYVSVRGNNTCPGGSGVTKIIRIPGSIQYHAYSSNNIGTLKNGKLIIPGKTWEQCGIGRGLWYITATFTPLKCWRDRGVRITRAVTPPRWICNPCNRPWPYTCGC
jgi:hypothetical protein